MAQELSEGALSIIMNGGEVDMPTMQILGSKRISGAGDNERYRLLVSDGVHVNSFAMLATQLNDRIRNGDLADNTIVKIKRFITSIVPNSGKGEKRVMIILDVEVIAPGSEVAGRIGNPVSWTPETAAAPSASHNGPTTNGHESSAPVAAPKVEAPVAPPPSRPSPAKPTVPLSPVKPSGGFGKGYSSNANSGQPSGGFGGGFAPNLRSPNKGMGGMEMNSNTHTVPIGSLTPYQNKWVIKARVTGKTAIRSWSNSKGEGQLFSFDLTDESGEIRVTAFKEQCSKYYEMIEVGKVYLISKADLKPANKRFSNLNNDYELTLKGDTQIMTIHEDDGNLPQIKFNFVPLSNIETMENQSSVDVIGIIQNVADLHTFVAKTTNKEMKKRDVVIVDKTKTSINLTLWGQMAEEFDGSNHPVVAVKGGRINEFQGGKSVSVSGNSTLQLNPDIPESHQLKGWFDHEGSTTDFKSLSLRTAGGGGMGSDGQVMTLREARDMGLGGGGKSDYYNCKATVIMIKTENPLYNACPGENCNKKVVDQNNGMYRCEKCNQDYQNYKPRYMLSINVADWTDHTYITLFQESAEMLLGRTAEEMNELKINNPDAFQQVFQQATFKSFQFRMRAQVQNYNDEQRLKTTVMTVKKIDHKAYCASLLSQLKELTGMGTVSN